MRTIPLLLLPLATGCRKIPPAPRELDELCSYLYAHFEDEDPAELEEGLTNLDAWLTAHLADTLEGYSVTSLSQDTVNILGEGSNADEMIGAAVGTESTFDPYALGVPQLMGNQEELFPDSHDHYERTYLTETDCFVDTKCDWAEVRNYIEDDYPIIGSVITHNRGQYRWLEPELGLIWIQRTWFEQPAILEVDWFELPSQYYLNVLLPREGGTLTLQSMWIEAYWDDLPVSENMAQSLLISQMQNVYAQLDEYVEAEGAAVRPKGCSTTGSRGSPRALASLGLLLLGLAGLRRRRP